MRHTISILTGVAILLASCERSNQSTEGARAKTVAQTALDPRASAIHLAALAAVVEEVKPHRAFTFASTIDFRNRILVGFPNEIERSLLAASGNSGLYVFPKDVVVPKEGEMETMNDGARRYVGLTSRTSGERIDAYMVESIEETSPTTVRVNWTKYCGPLAAQGGSVELVLKDGKWSAKEVKGGWVS